MQTITEQNRARIRGVAGGARAVGLAVFALGAFVTVATAWHFVPSYLAALEDSAALTESMRRWVPQVPEMLLQNLGIALLGLVLFGVGQFLFLVLRESGRAGWVLRHLAVVLYLCAAVACLRLGWGVGTVFGLWPMYDEPTAWTAACDVLKHLGHAVILVGLGLIAGRVVPMVEESKELV